MAPNPSDDELHERRRRALDIHDNVIQALVMAKLSLELGETEAGMRALGKGLAAAREVVTELLGDPEMVDVRRGPLRRSVPAGH